MMSGEAQLEALLNIINTSARQAIDEYKKGGNEVPTIYTKTQHPIDFEVDTVELRKAVRLLEGACQQLCASLAPPQHTLQNYATSFDPACLRVAIRAKIADVLEKYPDGLRVDALAEIVNLEQGKLSRILRSLVIKGCFTEVKPNVFANNRLSLVTRSSSPTSAVWLHLIEDVSHGPRVLYETITEPQYARSYQSEKAAHMYAVKQSGTVTEGDNFFSWIAAESERYQRFHRAMIGVGPVMGALSVLHHYPWSEVKTVCDVGGSVGTVTIPLLKMYPHLHIVDQDLPDVLVQAKEVWSKDAPEALEHHRVEFVPLDFFQESPVKGQDVYYLRYILHDWPDDKACIIMRNVRDAMAPHSRLLIHDMVLTPVVRDPNHDVAPFGVNVAPEPMLPNFGAGSARVYQLDMNMLCALNGKERTLEDLIEIGSAAGLRLEKVYDLVETAVLEFRVAT